MRPLTRASSSVTIGLSTLSPLSSSKPHRPPHCPTCHRHLCTTPSLLVKRPQKPFVTRTANVDTYGFRQSRYENAWQEGMTDKRRARLVSLAEGAPRSMVETFGSADGYGIRAGSKPKPEAGEAQMGQATGSEDAAPSPLSAESPDWKSMLGYRRDGNRRFTLKEDFRNGRLFPSAYDPVPPEISRDRVPPSRYANGRKFGMRGGEGGRGAENRSTRFGLSSLPDPEARSVRTDVQTPGRPRTRPGGGGGEWRGTQYRSFSSVSRFGVKPKSPERGEASSSYGLARGESSPVHEPEPGTEDDFGAQRESWLLQNPILQDTADPRLSLSLFAPPLPPLFCTSGETLRRPWEPTKKLTFAAMSGMKPIRSENIHPRRPLRAIRDLGRSRPPYPTEWMEGA